MFARSVVFVALSALGLVSAQSESNSTFKIPDPSSIDLSKRVSWCQGQTDSCGTLCGSAIQNACSTDDLNFQCVCQGGNSPDMNPYRNTMPWYVCTELQDECITANENNAAGQRNCTTSIGDNCGTEDIADHAGEGSSSGSSTSSASSTATASPSGTDTADSSSTPNAAPALPTANVQYFGNGAAAIAVGLLAYAL
ncbi:hypothetical protein F5X99DRAFT_307731 [Biscogniauxia marginata]|nr:hypothetical protein F5X99DRAFT_307731 [Biscogniauxia marginata]